ncbi:oxygenase MpaB family protein [Pseudonocardia humida]|nr:oxygenase MpaB family protein [Pseudonocardia humida]
MDSAARYGAEGFRDDRDDQDDDGLFGPDSVTWRVHLEPVMWVGGLRALLLQSLHPRVMRGTYQNSALFDPAKAWARFQRTVEFVGTRTFGSTAEVETAAARVRGLHRRLRGHDPDTGESFRLDEPEHLRWVHSTEVDSYAQVALRAGLLDGAGADRYLAESLRAARVIGLDDAPTSRAEMAAYMQRMRPRLALTDEARLAVGNLFAPKGHAPTLVKLAIPTVALVSLGTLPRWARRMYGLPGLPTTDLGVTATLRALRSATDVLPDVPAPPGIERARRLVRSADDVSGPRSAPRIGGG